MEGQEKIVSKFAPTSWKDKLAGSANILKVTTATAWKYISRLLGVFLLGLIVNVIFFIFLQSKIDYHLGQTGLASLGAIGAILCLFVIFPLLYFLVAHKHALQSVVYHIGNYFKTGIFEYFIDRLFEYAYKQPNIKAQLENNKIDDFFSITIPEYLQRLNNMNGTLKKVFRRFTENIDILAIFDNAKTELGENIALESLKSYVAQKAAEKIPLPLLSKPSWAWVITVMFINILFFATCLVLMS
jgi:hypothetical protein